MHSFVKNALAVDHLARPDEAGRKEVEANQGIVVPRVELKSIGLDSQ
jgi:hypothetical protein